MNENVAKQLRELDNIVFKMYEDDILTTEQFEQIHTQTINVRYSVKNLAQHIVSECPKCGASEKEAIDCIQCKSGGYPV